MVVVDVDTMSHAQLGDDNLLIVPGMTNGVLEVEADHSVLVVGNTSYLIIMSLPPTLAI